MASALLLSRQGHRVTLLERFASPQAVGAGILLQPSGMWVLQQLGVLQDVALRASRIHALHGVTGQRRVLDLKYSDYHDQAFGLGVHRGALFDALFKATSAASINIEAGSEVESIDPDGTITVAGKCRAFDLVIVASGAHTRLGRHLGLEISEAEYPWGAVWSVLPGESIEPGVLSQAYDGARKMAGLLPSGRDPNSGHTCTSFFYSVRCDQRQAFSKQPISRFQDQALALWPQAEPWLGRIESHDQFTFASYRDTIMSHWHSGRVVVIGDAAHAMSPQLGQGTNLALVDALELSSVLEQSRRSIPALLAQYSARRRSHIRFYQAASRILTPFYQSDSWWAGALRDWTTPIGSRVAPFNRQSLATLVGFKTGIFSSLLNKSEREQLFASIEDSLEQAPSA
ncbi:MAG: glutamate synthase [Lysobacteraceae bacterium]|nr:MAG: glutamate synthase [Xanthomonadaceae bacterium]